MPIAITGVKPGPDMADELGRVGFAAWEASAFGQDDAGRADRGRLLAEFTDFCRDHAETILVATEAGRVLGWGAREHMDHVISDLWVAPEAQGRGVGAALLAGLEAAIAQAEFGHAELETYAGNAGAVRFYERHGYETIWRGRKFTPSLGYALDKIRFRKALGRLA